MRWGDGGGGEGSALLLRENCLEIILKTIAKATSDAYNGKTMLCKDNTGN